MTALSSNRYTKHRDGIITAHPVKAATKIYKGSLVCADSTGYAVRGADSAGCVFLGIAIEEADNSSGANGALSIRVQTSGVFSFAKSGSITQASLGSALYIVDDQTVGLAATTTNDIACGRLEALDGSDAWLRVNL
jgi:hypothetical protein